MLDQIGQLELMGGVQFTLLLGDVEVEKFKLQLLLQSVNQDVLSDSPLRRLSAGFDLSVDWLLVALVKRHLHVWVQGGLQLRRTVHSDSDNTDGIVSLLRHQRFNVNVQVVRSIQHWAHVGIDQVHNQGLQPWDQRHDIQPESVTADWLQGEIDLRSLEELNRDSLDMWEVQRQVESHFHSTGHVHVFNQDRQSLGDEALTDSDTQCDFWIDLSVNLTLGHITGVVWSERESPVHLHNVLTQLSVTLDRVDSWCFRTQRELIQGQSIDTVTRSNVFQHVIGNGSNSVGQSRHIDDPELHQERVQPLHRLEVLLQMFS
ncbi:hypothetical protein WICPIJ_008905 [Wickerhamomyces pijperi]|uniref:Uncharacterized protein n=1 Tax=Wickerhamomyces pijperi TaxID=599730 RepID=A0A9P8PU47_WICPI|nr:hypothetical protein WICPIJ_008905 [Wickerhamomyces pijperi]